MRSAAAEADDPAVRRNIERLAAAAGAVFGIAGLGFVLFTPLSVAQDCVQFADAGGTSLLCRRALTSLFDEGGLAVLAGLLVPGSLFAAGGVAGWIHAGTRSRESRRMLWLATAAVAALTLALLFSLGPFMLPGALLLLYASMLARGGRAPAPAPRPDRASAA